MVRVAGVVETARRCSRPVRPGTDGQYRILVNDGGHVAQYVERYEVDITGYQLELEDHFAEPTSRVIAVPRACEELRRDADSRRVSAGCGAGAGALGHPRPGGAEVGSRSASRDANMRSTGKSLTAHVPELDNVPVGDPLRVTEQINPLAIQSRVNRAFANRHPRQEFTVAFPANWSPWRHSSRRRRAARHCWWCR